MTDAHADLLSDDDRRASSLAERALFLIQISRPILWPVLPLVYLLGVNASGAKIGGAATFQIALLTFPMSFIGCALNDLYDVEADRRSPRRRAIWGAVLRESDKRWLYLVVGGLVPIVALGAVLTRRLDNLIATALLLLTAWAYSVPPLRLKERPPLDSLANGLGYFLLPFVMGYSLNADPRGMPLKYYLLAVCVCGIHALATAADYDADRAAGHRTLAVAFGRHCASAFACATFLIALLLGDFQGMAARWFVSLGFVATAIAAVYPRHRVIMAACVTIFAGFLIAALCYVVGD